MCGSRLRELCTDMDRLPNKHPAGVQSATAYTAAAKPWSHTIMVQKVGILMGTGQCMRHLPSITSACQPMYIVLFSQLLGHAAQPLPQGSRTVPHPALTLLSGRD